MAYQYSRLEAALPVRAEGGMQEALAWRGGAQGSRLARKKGAKKMASTPLDLSPKISYKKESIRRKE